LSKNVNIKQKYLICIVLNLSHYATGSELNGEATNTSDKVGEAKGLLTTGATGKKKKNKKVSWAEESNLRVFHYFELDETERGEI
jgi:hypothetical protein